MIFAMRWAFGFWGLMALAFYTHGWAGFIYAPLAFVVGVGVAVAFD